MNVPLDNPGGWWLIVASQRSPTRDPVVPIAIDLDGPIATSTGLAPDTIATAG